MRICWIAQAQDKTYVPMKTIEVSENICARLNDGKGGQGRLVDNISYLTGVGEPLQQRDFVYRLKIHSAKKKISHVIRWGHPWIVSEKTKAVIEALEPGVHEFFEISITLRSGEPAPLRHYILNICQLVDAVDCKASQMRLTQSSLGHEYYSLNTATDFNTMTMTVNVIVDSTKVEGKHLWRDRWNRSYIFVSDEFKEAMQAAGIDDIDYRPRVIAKSPNNIQN